MLVTESMELPLWCFLHDIYFLKYVHIIFFLHDINLFFFWCSQDYMKDHYYDRITEVNLFNAFKSISWIISFKEYFLDYLLFLQVPQIHLETCSCHFLDAMISILLSSPLDTPPLYCIIFKVCFTGVSSEESTENPLRDHPFWLQLPFYKDQLILGWCWQS